MAIGILPQAQNYYATPQAPYFPGQTTAGFTPLQQQGFQAQLSGAQQGLPAAQLMAQQAQQQFGGGLAVNQNTAQQLNRIGSSYDPFLNPGIEGAMQAMRSSAWRDFNRNTIPQQEMSAIGAGMMGSSRHGIAQGLAQSDLQNQLLEKEAGTRAQMYQAGLDRYSQDRGLTINSMLRAQQQAPGALQAYGQAMAAPGQAMGRYGQTAATIGGAQQQLNQARIGGEMQRYQQQTQQPLQQLQNYANMVQGAPAGRQTSAVTNSPINYAGLAQNAAGVVPWGTLFGGGGNAAADPNVAGFYARPGMGNLY